MLSILNHIHSCPESKNKLTLGLLVAVTGVKKGHIVKLFLAANAVHALNCKVEGEIVGEGTGSGIGGGLLDATIKTTQSLNCDHLRLCNGLARSEANCFYETHGISASSKQYVLVLNGDH